MHRLSLRARLVLGVIVLAAVGLAVADVATYASLRSFLIDRTDQSLHESRRGFDRFLRDGRCEDAAASGAGRPPGPRSATSSRCAAAAGDGRLHARR